jgi:hypothetical protein
MVSIKLKWNKNSYDNVLIEPEKGVSDLKQKIHELTGVPPDRQKLMAKGGWIGTLKDDTGDENVFIYEHIHICIHVYIYICVYMYTCIYIRTYIYVYIYTYIYIYIYICI